MTNLTHGLSNTSEWRAWRAMRRRCYDTSRPGYRSYGGRGITVCERWLGDDGFRNFLTDMGPKPSAKHSLDRINNDGGYEPGNCRWATPREQSNNRRVTHLIEWNGRKQGLSQWAAELGMAHVTLKKRLVAGWPIHRALSTPVEYRTPRAADVR